MMGGGRNGSKYTSRNVVGQEEEDEDIDEDDMIRFGAGCSYHTLVHQKNCLQATAKRLL